jgi:hypothetical protein
VVEQYEITVKPKPAHDSLQAQKNSSASPLMNFESQIILDVLYLDPIAFVFSGSAGLRLVNDKILSMRSIDNRYRYRSTPSIINN